MLGLDAIVVKMTLDVTIIYATNMKNKVIEGQVQVEVQLAKIGVKLGENKPGCNRSMKKT